VRIRAAGGSWFVDMHATMDGDLSVRAAHAITEQIEERVRSILPGSDVTVHVEPYPTMGNHGAANRAATERE
jgi:ferrous-iron efflux pump FieF